MEFTPLLENQFNGNIFLNLTVTVLILATLAMLTLSIVTSLTNEKSSKRYWWVTGLLVLLGLLVTIPIEIASGEIKAKNQVIVEENMKKKYEINSILWDELGTNVEDYDGKALVAVRDSDDNIINYRYNIDSTTFEPSLVNIPDGGWRETKRPAKELLKTN